LAWGEWRILWLRGLCQLAWPLGTEQIV